MGWRISSGDRSDLSENRHADTPTSMVESRKLFVPGSLIVKIKFHLVISSTLLSARDTELIGK